MVEHRQHCHALLHVPVLRIGLREEDVDCLLEACRVKRLHLVTGHRRQHLRPLRHCPLGHGIRGCNRRIEPLDARRRVLAPVEAVH